MIIGIGIDIVDVKRIEAILKRRGKSFAQRILHHDEIKKAAILHDSGSSPMLAGFLAARFAAKEATAKALGTGFVQGLSFLDIRVFNDEKGKPELFFYNKAQEIAQELGVKNTHLSISHEKTMAVAQVILESRRF